MTTKRTLLGLLIALFALAPAWAQPSAVFRFPQPVIFDGGTANGVSGSTYSAQFNSDAFFKSGRPWIDVQSNAVGDGVTDDTTAIQNALNAADTMGGATVFLPPSKVCYKTTGTLTISGTTPIQLIGAGWNSVICPKGTNGGIKVGTTASDAVVGIRLAHFAITGQAGTGVGIEWDRVHNGVLDDVRVQFMGGDGVFAQGSYASRFVRVYSNNNGSRGFHIVGVSSAVGTDFTLLTQSQALANSSAGIYFDDRVSGPNGLRIVANDIEGNALGLQIDLGTVANTEDALIEGNYFENNTGSIIVIGGDASPTMFARSLTLLNNVLNGGVAGTNNVSFAHTQGLILKGNTFISSAITLGDLNVTVASSRGNTYAGTGDLSLDEQNGTASFGSAVSSVTVTLPQPRPSANAVSYATYCTIQSVVGAPVAGAFTCSTNTLSPTGFVLNLVATPGGTAAVLVGWRIESTPAF